MLFYWDRQQMMIEWINVARYIIKEAFRDNRNASFLREG